MTCSNKKNIYQPLTVSHSILKFEAQDAVLVNRHAHQVTTCPAHDTPDSQEPRGLTRSLTREQPQHAVAPPPVTVVATAARVQNPCSVPGGNPSLARRSQSCCARLSTTAGSVPWVGMNVLCSPVTARTHSGRPGSSTPKTHQTRPNAPCGRHTPALGVYSATGVAPPLSSQAAGTTS